MITQDKIKIYNKYGGDIDCLLRNSRNKDRDLIEGNDWGIIDNFLLDIGLINKSLTTQSYVVEALINIQKNCDKTSFDFFTDKIIFYHDFQNIAAILKQVKNKTGPDDDTVWVGVDNASEFLTELNNDITRIELCDFKALDEVSMKFAPTSTYQEISISNGWGKEYLKIAEDFDLSYSKIKTKTETAVEQSSKRKGSWFKRIFGIR